MNQLSTLFQFELLHFSVTLIFSLMYNNQRSNQQQKQNDQMNRKKNSNSYEGFRRKSSMSALESAKESDEFSINLLKFQNEEKINEVELLSLQLENLRRKSLTSRSITESQNMLSSRSMSQQREQIEIMSPTLKMTLNSKLKENQSHHENHRETKKSFKMFNTFETIEEDSYLNEQQFIDSIQPITLAKISTLPKKTKTILNQYHKKDVEQSKNDSLIGQKKERHKNQLKELQKMQKELEGKKIVKQSLLSDIKAADKIKFLKNKQTVVVKDLVKNAKNLNQLNKNTNLYNSVKNSSNRFTKSQKNLNLSIKLHQKKDIAENPMFEKIELMENIMKAERMLSEKQKNKIFEKISGIESIIQKNQISAGNFQEMLGILDKLEDLVKK